MTRALDKFDLGAATGGNLVEPFDVVRRASDCVIQLRLAVLTGPLQGDRRCATRSTMPSQLRQY